MPNRPRIALVDGYHDEAEMYAASLEHVGFAVSILSTSDIAIAVETIRRLQPDAVLTRVLPRRFGIELIRELRGDPAFATRPLIILTSLTHGGILDEARQCGATDVLLLPVSAADIVDVLRRELRGAQRSA